MSVLQNFLHDHPTPTFEDTFQGSSLNANNWATETYTSVRAGGETNVFAANSVIVGSGALQLRLTQNTSASLGAELQSANTYGYGLYQFTMRAGSNAATFDAPGTSISGGVSAGFNYWQINGGANTSDQSVTEIDWEVQGQSPSQIEMTSWLTQANPNEHHVRQILRACDSFHEYSFLWTPGKIEFYLDGLLLVTHTTVVPSVPAYILLNHWGSNDANFGGLRSSGISRYCYFKRVAFYSAT